MLAYATIGTNDLPRAAAFYDALLAEIGGKRMMEEPDYFIAWGTGQDGAGLGVTIPFDKQPATVANGSGIAYTTVLDGTLLRPMGWSTSTAATCGS